VSTAPAIAPCAEALQRLPAYLQQLEMESNGKRVDRAGEALPLATSPAVWGEPGTNAQQAYAQSQALMQGRDGGNEPHRHLPGNRPSTTLVLDRLAPRSLGALLALYGHRVFTSAAVWGINSFDQWGVELGKVLGARILPLLEPGSEGIVRAEIDASTAGLLGRLRA